MKILLFILILLTSILITATIFQLGPIAIGAIATLFIGSGLIAWIWSNFAAADPSEPKIFNKESK